MTERAPSSRSSSRSLLVGLVGRAVGLRGEVELTPVTDAPQRFDPGSVVIVRASGALLTVRSRRSHKARTIVSFEEVTDRTGAEALQGSELVIEHAQARRLEPGEYWDHELVGCRVESVEGEDVGAVTEVLHQPSSEVLVIATDSGQRLIPLVEAFVRSVEPGRRIVVDPIPGLLD